MAGGSEKGRSTQGGVTISLRQAATEFVKEQEKEWGKVLFSAGALRNRYKRRKAGNPVFSRQGRCRREGRDRFGRFAKGNLPWNKAMTKRVGGSTGSTVKEAVIPPVKPRSNRGRPARFTVAMDFATIAISQLSRIEVDDPKREIAFEKVIIWITENRYGRKGDSAW